MDKIAITHHLGHVSPVLDVARNLLTVSIKDGQGQGREEVVLQAADPFVRAQEPTNLGVHIIVCGVISQTALLVKGIKVIGSICGPLEECCGPFSTARLRTSGNR